MACAVLREGDPAGKIAAGAAVAAAWRKGAIERIGGPLSGCRPPDRPERPERPELRRPGDMPRRRITGQPGRIALLHAIAHIELNAVDLAWDIIARFANPGLPRAFYDDWVGVAADEGRHFTILSARLGELGAAYGDLPAHDGLWQAALDTADDLSARLAVVPLVLEARGLDVTPAMAEKLRAAGDDRSADILQLILDEEIGHVAAGLRWFEWSCQEQGLAPAATWQILVSRYFKGALKPPFNHAARQQAGMATKYYQPDV
jgi:uncharacterized ferritin-like protein (DUF455 family)